MIFVKKKDARIRNRTHILFLYVRNRYAQGFNGLSGLVHYHMEEVKGSNVVYAFINKSGDKLKLLHWSAGGFVLYYKRLEKGIFNLPSYELKEGLIVLSYTEMVMLLDGISIVNISRNERYLSTKKQQN